MTPGPFLFTVWSAIFFGAMFSCLAVIAKNFGWRDTVTVVCTAFLLCALVGLSIFTLYFLSYAAVVS